MAVQRCCCLLSSPSGLSVWLCFVLTSPKTEKSIWNELKRFPAFLLFFNSSHVQVLFYLFQDENNARFRTDPCQPRFFASPMPPVEAANMAKFYLSTNTWLKRYFFVHVKPNLALWQLPNRRWSPVELQILCSFICLYLCSFVQFYVMSSVFVCFFVHPYICTMAQKWLFLAILCVRQRQIARSGEYWYFLMTGEFLWNLEQRKWLRMAKNSIFWLKKLRQIQAVQNLARRPLLPFFEIQ